MHHYIEPGNAIELQFFETNETGQKLLVGKHPGLVLDIIDGYIYFLPISITYRRNDGTIYAYKRHKNNPKGLIRNINLNVIGKIPIANYELWFSIGKKEFLYILKAFIICQEAKAAKVENYAKIKAKIEETYGPELAKTIVKNLQTVEVNTKNYKNQKQVE